MKVKELIEFLQTLNQEMPIKVACDEEWNTIFNKFEIGTEKGRYIIFGLTGEEEIEGRKGE